MVTKVQIIFYSMAAVGHLTRDMKFWNQLNLNVYSSSQIANWMPNTLWSNFAIKKGWFGLANTRITDTPWILKCNFPLLKDLCLSFSSGIISNNKNLTRNSFRVMDQGNILQINPYIKKYFLRFFNRKSKWNKKPMLTAFDRNSNYNAIIVNSHTRGFTFSFKNRNAKTNMKYLKSN